MDLNKIIINVSLLLSQCTQPSTPEIPLFGIKITAADFKENLQSNIPFRVLLAKNTVHNIYHTGTALREKKYQKAGESILFAACSALTACLYPEDGSWGGYYKKKMSPEQMLVMSAICLASCGNTTFNPIYKDSEQLSLAEKLIAAGICALPFFYSFQYFALNINK